jgi:hypothetical protein
MFNSLCSILGSTQCPDLDYIYDYIYDVPEKKTAAFRTGDDDSMMTTILDMYICILQMIPRGSREKERARGSPTSPPTSPPDTWISIEISRGRGQICNFSIFDLF